MAEGFEGFEIERRQNIFEDVPRPSESAIFFGTKGITFKAHKPE